MLPCEVQCVLTFAVAAEEEGDSWWSFWLCCGTGIAVGLVLDVSCQAFGAGLAVSSGLTLTAQ